jgi:hypothetical protein
VLDAFNRQVKHPALRDCSSLRHHRGTHRSTMSD